jgi:hypothetical protein
MPADWIVCPRCLLKHSRRGDGRCPKCGTSIDGVVASAGASAPRAPLEAPLPADSNLPSAAATPTPMSSLSPKDEDVVPLGARIAAVILIVNALALVLERILTRSTEATAVSSPLAMIIDLYISGKLLAGHARFLKWTRIRVVLGAILFTAIHLFQHDSVAAVIQVAFSLGLLALLVGVPGRLRIGAGVALAGICLLLEGVGLIAEATGSNPLARIIQSRSLERPIAAVTGNLFDYHLRCPDGWYLLKADEMRRLNPEADRWITRPDKDAHLYVIAERLPAGTVADMAAFERIYVDHARVAHKTFELAAPPAITSPVEKARFLHTRSTIGGESLESYVGLFAKDNQIAQVVVVVDRSRFPALEAEFREMLSSFVLP